MKGIQGKWNEEKSEQKPVVDVISARLSEKMVEGWGKVRRV